MASFSIKRDGSGFDYETRMARNPRWNIEGGTYHVMNRGNRKALIFEDEHDCDTFARILIDVTDIHGVKVLAASLMRNHFHGVVTTPRGNLSDFMRELQGRYAQYSNRRHQRVGHLFQGRFRSVTIEHDVHLLIALCYVFLNPVAAGLCQRSEHYKWCTYAATAGVGPIPSYLSLEWLDALFPSESRRHSQRLLRSLLDQPAPVPAYLHGLDIGLDAHSLRTVVRSYVGAQLVVPRLPREYQMAIRPALSELLPEDLPSANRLEAIKTAREIHGYKCTEIARALRVHQSTVSKILRLNRLVRHAA